MSTDSGFARAQLPVISDERGRELRESARVAGYAAGWAQGSRAAAEAARMASQAQAARVEQELRAVQARFDSALEVLERAARATAQRTEPVLAEARATILAQSVELAEVLIGVELSDGERSARAALTRALAVGDVDIVAIRLNPADLAVVEELRGASDTTAIPDGVRLVADPALAPGEAISEYDGGFLDAAIDSAVRRARAALASVGQGES